MTNKQALQSVIMYQVSENLLDKQLIDCVIDGAATYTAADHDSIELCSAYVYKILATNPDFRQGSYAITNSQAAEFTKLANAIFDKYGKTDEIIGLKIKSYIF